jgi:hypothetical protein
MTLNFRGDFSVESYPPTAAERLPAAAALTRPNIRIVETP